MDKNIVIYMVNDNGMYMGRRIGDVENVMQSHDNDSIGDFTLTAPPSIHEKWYWIDNKWVADSTAS